MAVRGGDPGVAVRGWSALAGTASTAAARARRDRWHRVGNGRGSVGMGRRRLTAPSARMIATAAAAIRCHLVARSPAAVDDTGGLVVAHPVAPIVVAVPAARDVTAGREDRGQPDRERDR